MYLKSLMGLKWFLSSASCELSKPKIKCNLYVRSATYMMKSVFFHCYHPLMKVPQFVSVCASVNVKLHLVLQLLSYVILKRKAISYQYSVF